MATISRAIVLALAIGFAILGAIVCAPAKETVSVIGGNSGPRYDIDLTGEQPKDQPKDQQNELKPKAETNQDSSDQSEQPGRLAIRRLWIYSDPIQAPVVRHYNPWATFDGLNGDTGISPFMTRLRPAPTVQVSPLRSMFSEIFGPREETSGSTTEDKNINSSNDERELESRPTATSSNSDSTDVEPILRAIDPHQLMLDLLQQALNMRQNHFGDHFGSPSLSPFSPSSSSSPGEKPEVKTETKEDIVEIDGEKYLRKTVVNKHVGENVMFMTKKYILTPLNATTSTDDKSTNQTTTTTTPVSTLDKRQEGSSTTSITPEKPAEAPNSTPSDSETKPANVQPVFSDSTTTTTVAPAETTTTTTGASSAVPKDTIEKEGEVVVEQPELNSSPTTRERVIKRKGSDHED